MSVVMQRETTEYVYAGVTGTPPSVGAKVAFLDAAVRPTDDDWQPAIVVTKTDPKWADAVASGVKGDYYVAILVGGYQGNTVNPGMGDWQEWGQLTDTVEQAVRIFGTVEIQ